MSDADITSRAQIRRLLKSVQERELGVTLRLVDAEEPEASVLLALDDRHNELIFDAPRGTTSDRFVAGQRTVVSSRYQGIELRFTSPIHSVGDYDGYPAVRTGWPRRVQYLQRRRSFRVRVRNLADSKLDMYVDGARSYRARLLDLSTGGFGAVVPEEMAFTENEVMDCFIEVEGEGFGTLVEIRNVRQNRIGGTTRIGAQFSELTRRQHRRLEKLVRKLERRAIKGGSSQ